MSIHPILQIHPIIVPQHRFTDINGKPCAFLETNPSIYIDPTNGMTTILVRCVDYRKFSNKSFTLYQRQSNSKYFIGRTILKQFESLDINSIEFIPVNIDYGIPTYYTYWIGPEDIRFLDSANQIIATIPECNKDGKPAIFSATLYENKITNCKELKPNENSEKNWMPFITKEGELKVIYCLDPITIKNLENDERNIIHPTIDELRNYHGSTNGIKFRGGTLFLIHINKERTIHRWLHIDDYTYAIQYSKEFVFFNHTYIEFTCSLAIAFDRIFISCGINDDKAIIIEVSSASVNHQLTV